MRYFDFGEHSLNHRISRANAVAEIPKLGVQWKVIYDFKPTASNGIHSIGLGLAWFGEEGLERDLCIAFHLGMVIMSYGGEIVGVTNQIPEVGEWTRIELTQEFDEDVGRHTLSLSIGDNKVIQVDPLEPEALSGENIQKIGHFDIPNPSDVKPLDTWICIGDGNGSVETKGFVKRLFVLEKP